MLKDKVIKILFGLTLHDKRNPQIISMEETLDTIVRERVSVCRYGDGELRWMYGLKQLNFQKDNNEMSERLRCIIRQNEKKIIICLPPCFDKMDGFTPSAKRFWSSHMAKYRLYWLKAIDSKYSYYSAFCTRPYMAFENRTRCKYVFDMWKKVWENRTVILAEGRYTRFGVHNDILESANSVKRILCPEKNAYDKYDKILNEIKKQIQYAGKDSVVLIALGPTATIMAFELGMEGIQAIDIGHLDVEYEWYRMKVTKKVPILDKYVNEASNKGGAIYSDCLEQSYLSEIVAEIK